MFIEARHLSLSWIRRIQSIIPHHNCLRLILILSSNLRLDLPTGLFTPDISTKPSTHSFCPHVCYMLYPSKPPWLKYYWRRVHVMKLLAVQFSPVSYYFALLSPMGPMWTLRTITFCCYSLVISEHIRWILKQMNICSCTHAVILAILILLSPLPSVWVDDSVFRYIFAISS
jgi:hypothetical protein